MSHRHGPSAAHRLVSGVVRHWLFAGTIAGCLSTSHAPHTPQVNPATSTPALAPGSPQDPRLDALDRATLLSRDERWPEAVAAWQTVVEQNPVNGGGWFELARARTRAHDDRGAIAAYERLLAVGSFSTERTRYSFPSTIIYEIARCHMRLGDRDAALASLERAFEAGYRYVDEARKDETFAALRDDKRFRTVVGLPEAASLPRDAGWRFDLGLLLREVKRRGYDPFRRISRADFEKRVADLEAAVPHLTDMQIIVAIMGLLRDVGDGHTAYGGGDRPELKLTLPLKLYLFEDGLYVVAADPRWRDLVGAKVLRIGGHTIDDVLHALDPVISRDNEVWPKEVAPFMMRSTTLLHTLGLVPDARGAPLTIVDRAGAQRDVLIAADDSQPDIWNVRPYPPGWIGVAESLPEPRPVSLQHNEQAYWFRALPDAGAVYVQYNVVANDPSEPLARFAERLTNALRTTSPRKLVIDLRNNNGGDSFRNEVLLEALLGVPWLRERGRFVVMIGRRTFSAAINAVLSFERFMRPIFVGEPTGGKPDSVGDEVPFELPYSRIDVNVSDLYWEGWPQDHRAWIAPDVYAPPTFAALRSGRDPALEAALAAR